MSIIKLIKVPKIDDDCYLSFFQNNDQIPFNIKRVYYIYKAKPNLPRGFHAHHKNKQVLFCIQGSIKMIVDNGKSREEFILSDPSIGIFLDKMIWHEMHNFSHDTILMVVASEKFNKKDYIRDYNKFLSLTKNEH